jgi:site-specific recombinase XerD
MAHGQNKAKHSEHRTVLRFPDLEQSKNAVLNSLSASSSQVSYGHAIDEFIGWYCSEPRLAFNRAVVLRYRFFLECKNLAPSTINVRLAAVRRLAYEAADTGLLTPELAAGIRRVKGGKRLGVRIGNWLTVDQSKMLLQRCPLGDVRGKRDRAILGLLIGCGLRRAELVGLRTEDFQVREEHWVIADLIGKGKHIRTVPVPAWVKRAVDEWMVAAENSKGQIFRRVNRFGEIWGGGITPKAIWHVVKAAAHDARVRGKVGHQTAVRLAGHLLDPPMTALLTASVHPVIRRLDSGARGRTLHGAGRCCWATRRPIERCVNRW